MWWKAKLRSNKWGVGLLDLNRQDWTGLVAAAYIAQAI